MRVYDEKCDRILATEITEDMTVVAVHTNPKSVYYKGVYVLKKDVITQPSGYVWIDLNGAGKQEVWNAGSKTIAGAIGTIINGKFEVFAGNKFADVLAEVKACVERI